MRSFQRLVGSVHNLVVFEAAARHGSFSRAARELSVTQPAVSQAIRRLEEVIGASLFVRGHRSITLTEAGERLFDEVGNAFARISDTVARIGRPSQHAYVTITTSTAFAVLWLTPRLAAFRAACPSVELRVETVRRDTETVTGPRNLSIHRGDGHWADCEAELIAPEVLFIVASPGFIDRHPYEDDLSRLAHTHLIHLEEPYRYRPGWPEFFASHKTSFADHGGGLRLNDYVLVIEAAAAGEGLALGWSHLCGPLIQQGKLKRVGNWEWRTPHGFYLLRQKGQNMEPETEAVRRWFIEQRDRSASAPGRRRPDLPHNA